jgi:hypothetical protein
MHKDVLLKQFLGGLAPALSAFIAIAVFIAAT